ncbi:MAG: UTP--glucose-1-phosphate uridylyltransferase [Candidatus Nealsonbacteria bacterium]|nr:UTP--glucose-1-phosphate uridylyltransferase [Candidatus Nealsonbacteria bacterium]
MSDIKKAIIPIAGLGTRLLPLSKAVPKEFLPLADKSTIQYLLEEARASGIQEVVFVVSAGKQREISSYFNPSQKLEKFLQDKKKEDILEELNQLKELSKSITFSFATQKEPLGDGHAVLQAKRYLQEPCGVFFADDVVDAKTPCLTQLLEVFQTCQKPVIALKKLPKEKLPHYGVVGVEKIASRLYKIKEIVEKPAVDSAPSDLAIVGRYVITPEVFEFLKNTPRNEKGEIILAQALKNMIQSGKTVYGYEIEGEWLECGDKLRWMKSNLYFSLHHPSYGEELRKFLKETKNL